MKDVQYGAGQIMGDRRGLTKRPIQESEVDRIDRQTDTHTERERDRVIEYRHGHRQMERYHPAESIEHDRPG